MPSVAKLPDLNWIILIIVNQFFAFVAHSLATISFEDVAKKTTELHIVHFFSLFFRTRNLFATKKSGKKGSSHNNRSRWCCWAYLYTFCICKRIIIKFNIAMCKLLYVCVLFFSCFIEMFPDTKKNEPVADLDVCIELKLKIRRDADIWIPAKKVEQEM